MIISSRRVRVLKHILIVPIIITMHAKFKFFLHCLKFIYIMNAPPAVPACGRNRVEVESQWQRNNLKPNQASAGSDDQLDLHPTKEIFLRELISNASDAEDKLCYLALTDDKVGMNRSDFKIEIKADPESADPDDHRQRHRYEQGGLGKQSGRDRLFWFLPFPPGNGRKDEKNEDVDIIGQFGVGFYSAFMVADTITVTTKKYGEEQAWQWKSSGVDGYTVTEAERDGVGTDIVMHIKGRRRGRRLFCVF